MLKFPWGFHTGMLLKKVENKGAKNGNGSLKVFEDVNKT